MKRNRSKAWNWILTLTFVVVMLLGMTVAASATEYNSDSIKAAGSDGIYLKDGDDVNIVGKTILIDQDSYVPTSVITIRWEAWNQKVNCRFTHKINDESAQTDIQGDNPNDGQWHIAAAEPGSGYDYVMTWVNCYPLWVGGIQVTSKNADDVFNDQKVKFTPAVPATDGNEGSPATLTLNDYTGSYNGENDDIKGVVYYSGKDQLKIVVNGTNNNLTAGDSHSLAGIWCGGPLLIEGNGTLNATGGKGKEGNTGSNGGRGEDGLVGGDGIFATGSITIAMEKGIINAKGGNGGSGGQGGAGYGYPCGGDAGNGANGGAGIKTDNTDNSLIVKNGRIDTTGGNGGTGGLGGYGSDSNTGKGGNGGNGGNGGAGIKGSFIAEGGDTEAKGGEAGSGNGMGAYSSSGTPGQNGQNGIGGAGIDGTMTIKDGLCTAKGGLKFEKE